MEKELNNRFRQLKTIHRDGETYFFIEAPGGKSCNILMTSGLSEYEMSVENSHQPKSIMNFIFYCLIIGLSI